MREKAFAAGVALVGALLAFAPAQATVTCTSTIALASGKGFVDASSISAGTCVHVGDKLYGNFDLGNLPGDLVLNFNTNTVGSLVHEQLSWDASFAIGTTYDWDYEVMLAANAIPGTLITSVDSDFTQTVSAETSTLDKTLSPTGTGDILVKKNGPVPTPDSVFSSSFAPGILDLVIGERLVDNGTISSVTNTITETLPNHGPGVPEPMTLTLLGAGLAGLGGLRLRRRR